MKELLMTPQFNIFMSIVTFELGIYIQKKTKFPLFHPLLISIGLIIGILLTFDIPLESYQQGGDMITLLLGPATVILAVPLYKQLDLLKKNAKAITIGIISGVITSIGSVYILSRIFGYDQKMLYSIIPKSITTPIGIELTKTLGGIPSITVIAIILTGISGAVIAPTVCRLLGIKNKVAIGIAIGTASHAVGTTKAMEIGETEGAMSGLSIGLSGLMTLILAPLILKIFG